MSKLKITVEVDIVEAKFKEILSSIVVLYDSREKSNQHILDWFEKQGIKTQKHKLDVGDYSFMLPRNEFTSQDLYFTNHIVIEKKNSIEELSGNFSTDRLRLESEFAEMYDKDLKSYLLIENCSFGDILDGNYKTQYNKSALTSSFISFMDRYNFTPIFVDKSKSAFMIFNLFKYYLRNLVK